MPGVEKIKHAFFEKSIPDLEYINKPLGEVTGVFESFTELGALL